MDLQFIFYWVVTFMALVGVVLNIKQDRKCFYIWAVTNSAFAVESFWLGAWNMAFLFTAYFILAIVGLVQWKD